MERSRATLQRGTAFRADPDDRRDQSLQPDQCVRQAGGRSNLVGASRWAIRQLPDRPSPEMEAPYSHVKTWRPEHENAPMYPRHYPPSSAREVSLKLSLEHLSQDRITSCRRRES